MWKTEFVKKVQKMVAELDAAEEEMANEMEKSKAAVNKARTGSMKIYNKRKWTWVWERKELNP